MTPADALPAGTVLSYYGDDFTGSAAVMEVLTSAGLPTVLFLDVPTAKQLAAFSGYRAIGIAGTARAQNPAWMDAHLPRVFEALRNLDAPIAHYKTCSTFDSSPTTGSIGRAIDLAAPILGGDWHPLLVAAPAIGRFQAFGNLFAVAAGVGYRLDRHPTMRRHPTTPMSEADVRRHLADQTATPVGLVDVVAMSDGTADATRTAEIAAGAKIIALDVMCTADLATAGALMWHNRGDRLFAVGSQGVEYALVAHWRESGQLEPNPTLPTTAAVDQMITVSGSCAPETAGQISWAAEHGFQPIAVDAVQSLDQQTWPAEQHRVVQAALAACDAGQSPLIYSASGPDDPAVARYHTAVADRCTQQSHAADSLGTGMGDVVAELLRTTGLRRAVICGGDTSSFAAPRLGIYALTVLTATTPGASLSKAYSDDIADLEIAMKGGQMGPPDYLGQIRNGGQKAS